MFVVDAGFMYNLNKGGFFANQKFDGIPKSSY